MARPSRFRTLMSFVVITLAVNVELCRVLKPSVLVERLHYSTTVVMYEQHCCSVEFKLVDSYFYSSNNQVDIYEDGCMFLVLGDIFG